MSQGCRPGRTTPSGSPAGAPPGALGGPYDAVAYPWCPHGPRDDPRAAPRAFQHANTRNYGLMPLRDVLRDQQGQEAGAGISG